MSDTLAVEELRRRVAAIRWFHTIDLGNGIVTPGEDESLRKLPRFHLPERLDGKSVLDVGAWDGFFSFEAERRGAARTVAMDPACWGEPAWGERGWGTRRGFDLARQALGSGVEPLDVSIPIPAVSPETTGTFDVVLFLGVLYHLPGPWPYLAAVAGVTRERLIIETHVDLLHVRRPAAAYYPGDAVDSDQSNFWGPNVAMLVTQLRSLGFRRMTVYRESLPYRLARSAYRRVRPPRFPASQGRCVVHAVR
jgi:tRNA (mo5U34)-methyltransferase